MDLGISGRKAIVCASSRGLGKGCAWALAEAGCEVTVNGRDKAVLNATADEIRQATGATVHVIAADVSTPEGQKALLGACPQPDILVNNNGGPPRKGQGHGATKPPSTVAKPRLHGVAPMLRLQQCCGLGGFGELEGRGGG